MIYDGAATPTVTKVTLSGLESGKSYWVGYKVLNYAGWSLLSSPYLQLTAGLLPSPPSSAPTQLGVSETSIRFSWTPSLEIGGALLTNYRVYSNGSLVVTLPASTLSYEYTGVTAGQSYSVTVSAVSLVGEGDQSNPAVIWAIDLADAPTF